MGRNNILGETVRIVLQQLLDIDMLVRISKGNQTRRSANLTVQFSAASQFLTDFLQEIAQTN